MEVNLHLSLIILRTLIHKGCTQYVFSPGARNSPLIRALFFLAERYKLEIDSHFDERGAAFFALGLAKSSALPVAMITTSGSAVANLFPAVVEAYYSEIPLILISADRPLKIHNMSANQTINQEHFFKGYVQGDLMIKDYSEISESQELELSEDLDKVMIGLYDGPIHINCPFDEPLLSTDLQNTFDEEISEKITKLLNREGSAEAIYNSYSVERKIILDYPIPSEVTKHFLGVLKQTVKGFIVVGELEQNINKKLLVDFLELFMEWGWYVLLEVNSGLRHLFPHPNEDMVLINYHHFLEHQRMSKVMDFDTVIHLGGKVISKSLSQYFKSHQQLQYVHVNYSKHNYNPDGCVKVHYKYAVSGFTKHFMKLFQKEYERWTKETLGSTEVSFKLNVNPWIKKVDNELSSYIDNYVYEAFNELEISRTLANHIIKMKHLGNESRLFLGNSMPIRDFNLINKNTGFSEVFANRGASGIDGLIATASGIAKEKSTGFARTDPKPRFYILIGDLSTLHDLNSLIFCKKNQDSNIPMTVIVINNQEGTIFRYLPIANIINQYPGHGDFYYSHEYNFSGFAQGVGMAYEKVSTIVEFSKALNAFEYNKQSLLLELKVDSDFNQNVHTRFQNDVFNHINYLIDLH